MYRYLDQVNSPQDIKKLNIEEMDMLAKDIRKFLVKSISETGGHLASNLGIVELTLALHKVFDSPNDKFIWDVGHQAYVHKIITGRKDLFSTLRQLDGLSGFPKEEESEHDIFDTGHSSTSISAALGIAKARDIKKDQYSVIPIIGDGALTGGIALEALNYLGDIGTDMTVILNDNEMSIDKNVGGMSKYFSRLIKNSSVDMFKDEFEKLLSVTSTGEFISKTAYKLKDTLINSFGPEESEFFDSIGIKYIGPIDGHDIHQLLESLNYAKMLKGPVLLHVITKKGRGYRFAENQPDKYHGVSKFDIKEGVKPSSKKSISEVVGEKLVDLASKDESVVAITAAMPSGTGLDIFEKSYPNRFFDVGIAEQHATTFAAGLAKNGMKPYFAVYSTFLQRAYDQVIHDVCLTNKPVTFMIDRAGLVGNDGETHHGVYDLSFLNPIPNIVVMAPKDTEELKSMIDLSMKLDSPVAIRYARGSSYLLDKGHYGEIELGKSEVLNRGKNVAVLAIGNMVKQALDACEELKKDNIDVTVVNARFLKPMDDELLRNIFENHKNIITIEDNSKVGGYGSSINDFALQNHFDVNIVNLGIGDSFIEHGSQEELYEIAGISAKKIKEAVEKMI